MINNSNNKVIAKIETLTQNHTKDYLARIEAVSQIFRETALFQPQFFVKGLENLNKEECPNNQIGITKIQPLSQICCTQNNVLKPKINSTECSKLNKESILIVPEKKKIKTDGIQFENDIKIKKKKVNKAQKAIDAPKNALPSKNLENPLYLVPFQNGWKRECVYRVKSSSRKADIYYYTPEGVKLRSKNDFKKYRKN